MDERSAPPVTVRIVRRRRGLRRAIWTAVALIVAGGILGVPEAMLAIGTRRARMCLASYELPRDAERPRCASAVEWMLFPARVPWTSNRARYRAEELMARIAVLDYLDASAGTPDAKAREAAAERLATQATVIAKGSQRLSLEELGRSIGAPDPGRDADLMGDRRSLIERGHAWLDWRVRLASMRASLLEARMDRALELARQDADFDPHDQDVRTGVAALLCIGDDAKRGLGLLPWVQDDRASRRYEGMSRNWGEVRALIVACAARVGVPPPPMPENVPAGSADAVEARAVLRLELAAKNGGDARDAAVDAARRLLEGGSRSPGARVAILASILAAGATIEPAALARYARAETQVGEPPLVPELHATALGWLSERRRSLGDVELPPVVAGATFVQAARRAAEIANGVRDDAALVAELGSVRGALWLAAAAALSREGDGAGAAGAAGEAADALGAAKEARALWRSNGFWLSGDRPRALAELGGEDLPAIARDTEKKADSLGAAVLVQRAELLASLGRGGDALAAAAQAREMARAAGDEDLAARARWLMAALGPLPAEVGPPLDPLDLTEGTPLPWVGFANPIEPWRTSEAHEELVERALGAFTRALAAPAPVRRAIRLAAQRSRGDAPPWLGTHLALGARLLAPGEGDPEIWLDALSSVDARRFSLRQVAFARMEAARMRGDMDSARVWEDRYRFLRDLASDPSRALLARHAGI